MTTNAPALLSPRTTEGAKLSIAAVALHLALLLRFLEEVSTRGSHMHFLGPSRRPFVFALQLNLPQNTTPPPFIHHESTVHFALRTEYSTQYIVERICRRCCFAKSILREVFLPLLLLLTRPFEKNSRVLASCLLWVFLLVAVSLPMEAVLLPFRDLVPTLLTWGDQALPRRSNHPIVVEPRVLEAQRHHFQNLLPRRMTSM